MARNIKLDQVGDYVTEQFEKLLRVAVLETDSRLKRASPVDTGRFRASWQVGENAAPGGIASEGQFDTGKTFKTSKRGRSTQEVLPIQRLGYGQERVGNVYSVHNNLPYAEPLAGGNYPPSWGGQYRSKQAQPGWVQGIAKDIQGFVQANANRIGRES
jgi:hypothetical protein